MIGSVVSLAPTFMHSVYPNGYAKGNARMAYDARNSPMAQAYRRGQNSTQRKAIHPIHTRSNNEKCGGYTSPVQLFLNSAAWGPMSAAPSAAQSRGMQRVSQPSLNFPAPPGNIQTKMPWNSP